MTRRNDQETEDGAEALNRLLAVAERDPTASRVAANLILAWWNAGSLRGFDLTDLWLLDDQHQRDARGVIALAGRCHCYPDAYVARSRILNLIDDWRPSLARCACAGP
jgi:hypothetical protein